MNGEIEILLHHGWGWDPSIWSRQAASAGTAQLVQEDRGYFGEPVSCRCPAAIVIAHSLGLHLLRRETISAAKLLVVISGFQYFHNRGATGERTRRQVRRMLARLEEEPYDLIRDFRTRSLLPRARRWRSPDVLHREPLRRDLELLDTHRIPVADLRLPDHVLLLHGDRDAIVSARRSRELHQQLPNSSIQILPGAGHALPLTHGSACWAAIEAEWAALATEIAR